MAHDPAAASVSASLRYVWSNWWDSAVMSSTATLAGPAVRACNAALSVTPSSAITAFQSRPVWNSCACSFSCILVPA